MIAENGGSVNASGAKVRVRVLHGQPLAATDMQVRPSIAPIGRPVRGHRCVRFEGGRHTVTYTQTCPHRRRFPVSEG